MRLTEEREAEIRESETGGGFARGSIRELLSEIDALRAELEVTKYVQGHFQCAKCGFF